MKMQKPSSLFWSWGAFVFLPINIIIGSVISTDGASIEELALSLIMALFIMMALAYPAIRLSSKTGLNYAQSIRKYIKRISLPLILLIPIINMGWYSIQTAMFVDLIKTYMSFNQIATLLLILCFSYVFAVGVTKYDYAWLQYFGLFGMVCLVFLVAMNLKFDSNIAYGYLNLTKTVNYTIQILGTSIFSSVTYIMDITAHIKDGKKGFKYIIAATFVADFMLIFLGYIMNISIESFVSLGIVNLLVILVAIWTTNDSNFYSILCSLKELGFSKKSELSPYIRLSLINKRFSFWALMLLH